MVQDGYRVGRVGLQFDNGIEREWLLTNGIGGFASMSVIGAQTRLQSSYLTASFSPPVDRYVILSNVRETVVFDGKGVNLAAQSYLGYRKEGNIYLNSFEYDILPTYFYHVDDFRFKKTVGLVYGENTSFVYYDITAGERGGSLIIMPCFNYRPIHTLSKRSDLRFGTMHGEKDNTVIITPEYLINEERHIVCMVSSGRIEERKDKKSLSGGKLDTVEEGTLYDIDVKNGLGGLDSHYTPYDIVVELGPFEKKSITLITTVYQGDVYDAAASVTRYYDYGDTVGQILIDSYIKRVHAYMDKMPKGDTFARRLAWAADSFIAYRKSTELKTILAGFPHFADRGRDTMIALTGLTLCTGRFEDCREIMKSFVAYLRDGLIPNFFPDTSASKPLYNTMDASLWLFYAAEKYMEYTGDDVFIRDEIFPVLKEVVDDYMKGTEYTIYMDDDGLITGGSEFDQITWMDSQSNERIVTPRHGKPVEINALWYNALVTLLEMCRKFEPDNFIRTGVLEEISERVKESFVREFWNEEKKCLYDVVRPKDKDDSVRPNQIYAVSLPHSMLDRDKEIAIVRRAYAELYTPLGIRSLSNKDARFEREYIGRLKARTRAYHMGTAWAYISGAFITAFCKVHDYDEDSVNEAMEMIAYFNDHLSDGCLNGIAEVFDGEVPTLGRGCFTQAWSIGEILRAYIEVRKNFFMKIVEEG